MNRTINNIKVLGKTIYVDFTNGRFGTHTLVDGKWIDHNVTEEEMKFARSVALKSGKWTNWHAPRNIETGNGVAKRSDEDAREDLESMSKFEHDNRGEGNQYSDQIGIDGD